MFIEGASIKQGMVLSASQGHVGHEVGGGKLVDVFDEARRW